MQNSDDGDSNTDDDDGGTSEQDERTGTQVNPVVMRSNPNHNMVPLAKQKSSPGDNLMNLRDRGKSASSGSQALASEFNCTACDPACDPVYDLAYDPCL